MNGNKMKLLYKVYLLMLLCLSAPAYAAPELAGERVTDVTTSSFSVVWMTNVADDSGIEVASNSSMTNLVNDSVEIWPMHGISGPISDAARSNGILKATVTGLDSGTTYYVRVVARNPSNHAEIAYSPVLAATTEVKVTPFKYDGGVARGISNDLKEFPVYLRPSEVTALSGLGNLVILEADGASYPVTVFTGEGAQSPGGLVDLNNLFGTDGTSLDLVGGEKLLIRVYKGDLLHTLTHFRKVQTNSGLIYVSEPERGFFADINVDGNVDNSDFEYFRAQYRALPEDENYNPDYNFVNDEEGKVDIREFSKFALEYGRTGVE